MFRPGIACLALLLLSACAPFHKQLTAENKAKITDVDVRVVVAQEGFMLSAQAPGISAATGGGLIPALIDAGIQQSRQKSMTGEIRATTAPLIEHDFRAQAAQAVSELQGAGAFPLKVRSAQVLAGLPATPEHNARIQATATGPAYLVMLLQYSLEPGLGAFTTRTTALLWQGGAAEPSYRSAAIFQAPTVGASRADVVKWLTADKGQVLTGLMHDSVAETLRMVATDIADSTHANAAAAAAAREKQAELSSRFNFNGQWIQVKGKPLDTRPPRTVLKDQAGALYSLSGAQQ